MPPPNDYQLLKQNLIVTGLLIVCLGVFQAIGYLTATGLMNLVYGCEVADFKSKQMPIGAVAMMVSSGIVHFFAAFLLGIVPIVHRLKEYRILQTDGFEKYEVRFCRGYAKILSEFADGVSKKNGIRE